MYTEDWFVNYRGFRPSDFTRHFMTDLMAQLLDEAPYGASLRANFSRHDGELKGRINIHSPAGSFEAFAKGRRLTEVSKKLTSQIRRRLRRWKEERFGRHKILKEKEVNYDSDAMA